MEDLIKAMADASIRSIEDGPSMPCIEDIPLIQELWVLSILQELRVLELEEVSRKYQEDIDRVNQFLSVYDIPALGELESNNWRERR